MKDSRKLQEKVATFAEQMAYSPEKLGPNVKLAREHMHITQEQAAARVGVAVRTYVAWEHGHAMPRGHNLTNLAKALKVDTVDLLNGVNDSDDQPLSEQLAEMRAQLTSMQEKLDAVIDIFTGTEQVADAIDRRRAAVAGGGSVGSDPTPDPPSKSHVPRS